MSDTPHPSGPAMRPHKPTGRRVTDQQRRRELALERQRAARRDLQSHARELAHSATTSSDSGPVPPSALASSADAGIEVAEGEGIRGVGYGSAEEAMMAEGQLGGADQGAGRREASSLLPEICELDESSGRWARIDQNGVRIESGIGTGGVTNGAVPRGEGEGEMMEEDHEIGCGRGGEREGQGEGGGGAQGGGEDEGAVRALGRGMAQLQQGDSDGARDWYSQQLMLPEWMVDVPPRLASDWFVMPRPDGRRCLVISANGTTISRLRNGRTLHRFPSMLPNGARAPGTAAASHVYCILDCVFHEPNSTYYVLDVMAWRGYSLYDCATDFRFFWLQSKLQESGACSEPHQSHRFRFQPLPFYECNAEGLKAAYGGGEGAAAAAAAAAGAAAAAAAAGGAVDFQRDGLLFYNRHTHYTLGITPLVLQWKDEACSRFVVDTDANGVVPHQQELVLSLSPDGSLVTSDEPPVSVGVMQQQQQQYTQPHAPQQPRLKPGKLLRFAIGPGGMHLEEGRVVGADLIFLAPANQRRGGADSCSKILFQYAARNCPLTIRHLAAAVTCDTDDE